MTNTIYIAIAILLCGALWLIWLCTHAPLDDMQFDVPSDFRERSGRDRRAPVTNSDEAFIGKQRGTERRKS